MFKAPQSTNQKIKLKNSAPKNSQTNLSRDFHSPELSCRFEYYSE